MPRMLVVTDAETAVGFQLAGVEALATTAEAAVGDLERAILTDAYGLVVVDESLVPDPLRALERLMRGRELPLLLPMPGLSAAFDRDGDAVRFVGELVRRAIGFDVKLD